MRTQTFWIVIGCYLAAAGAVMPAATTATTGPTIPAPGAPGRSDRPASPPGSPQERPRQNARASPHENPLSRALRFFETLPDGGKVGDLLRKLRPWPAGREHRDRVLRGLPPVGDLRPDHGERVKLDALAPVLAYHDRLGVFTVKLIDLPQAFLGLHARSVLLISRKALQALSPRELQALAAHEAGHELFWEEYYEARARQDDRALQEIELKCDGIAALTLLGLGLDPGALVPAARKLIRVNEAIGATENAGRYPAIADRRELVRELTARYSRQSDGPIPGTRDEY